MDFEMFGDDMPGDEMDFVKRMSFEMGRSFFNAEEDLVDKVDADYKLPWSGKEELDTSLLDKLLGKVEQTLDWEIGEFFDDKNLSVLATYKYTDAEEDPEVDFDEVFSVEVLDYDLKCEKSQSVGLKSNTGRSGHVSNSTSQVNGVTTRESGRKYQFDLDGQPESLSGSVKLKMAMSSGYDIKVLTKDDVGQTFDYQGGTYKVLSFEGGKVLLEVLSASPKGDLDYICTNADDLQYQEESTGFDFTGMGNSMMQFYRPLYNFFSESPEGDFEAFSKYFDENIDAFMAAENSSPEFIGFCSPGVVDKLYLYAPKTGAEKIVEMSLS